MMTSSARARRVTMLRQALCALVVAAVVVGGCGLSEDGAPRPIAADKLPADLINPNPSTTTTLPPADTVPVTIYLLRTTSDEAQLVPVEREVTDPQDAGARIQALLSAEPTDPERAQGLSSAIPDDVTLLEARHNREARVLVIDLSQAFLDVQGTELTYRFAQLVFTAAELDGVRSIRFSVDGEAIQALDDEGNEQSSVDKSDYAALSPR